MAIADKVERYEVFIDQNDYVDYYRSIKLSLESGGEAFIGFPAVRPPNWLQFNGNDVVLYMFRRCGRLTGCSSTATTWCST
jgi:hypothetical protein